MALGGGVGTWSIVERRHQPGTLWDERAGGFCTHRTIESLSIRGEGNRRSGSSARRGKPGCNKVGFTLSILIPWDISALTHPAKTT